MTYSELLMNPIADQKIKNYQFCS